jgi:hypothetical protein
MRQFRDLSSTLLDVAGTCALVGGYNCFTKPFFDFDSSCSLTRDGIARGVMDAS